MQRPRADRAQGPGLDRGIRDNLTEAVTEEIEFCNPCSVSYQIKSITERSIPIGVLDIIYVRIHFISYISTCIVLSLSLSMPLLLLNLQYNRPLLSPTAISLA